MNTVYEEVRSAIVELPIAEKWRLLEELITDLRHAESPKKRSIMEIEGLGADVWQDEDAQEYVNRERAAWSG